LAIVTQQSFEVAFVRPVIVDTNIIFSTMLREQSQFLQLILDGKYDFFVCELILMELFKHKEKDNPFEPAIRE
jgi:predicted nucleic acid-binding protein